MGWQYRVHRCGCGKAAVTTNADGDPVCAFCLGILRQQAALTVVELEPDECHCVLPEQSCPACRAIAAEIYKEIQNGQSTD